MQYGLIFDMDGVLVDSARPHFESWKRLGQEIGTPLPEHAFLETFGRRNPDVIEALFSVTDGPTVARLDARKEEIYRNLVRDNLPVMDGAVELIHAAHAEGFKLAIGSSGPPANIDLVLEGMGVADCFEVRITADEVTRGKPDPQVFLLAAERLGLPPTRCAVVEDAPSGVKAALAAGAVAIALAGTHPADRLQIAHRVVPTLRHLTPASIRTLIHRVYP